VFETWRVEPLRSLLAVLVGLVLVRLLGQILEQTLVLSLAGEPPADMAAYVAVRNRAGVTAVLLFAHAFVSVMAGYVVGKIAGDLEVRHALVVGVLQLALFVWAFAVADAALLPPVWARVALLVVTLPALLAGATIRADARALHASPVPVVPTTKEQA
jgi:hypothetical protein